MHCKTMIVEREVFVGVGSDVIDPSAAKRLASHKPPECQLRSPHKAILTERREAVVRASRMKSTHITVQGGDELSITDEEHNRRVLRQIPQKPETVHDRIAFSAFTTAE